MESSKNSHDLRQNNKIKNNKKNKIDNLLINELVNKSQNGDEQAFNELAKIFYPRVRNIIKRYITDTTEVSDVLQEVFFRVHRYIGSFKGESSFYTWLYSVSTSVAKNHVKMLKKTPLITTIDTSFTDYMDFAVDVHQNNNPQDIVVSDETQDLLIDTLNLLPTALKEVIVLREIEGQSYLNISKILDIPEGTVRSRLHRAREIIETNISDSNSDHNDTDNSMRSKNQP